MNHRIQSIENIPTLQLLGMLVFGITVILYGYGRDAVPGWAALLICAASLTLMVWSNIHQNPAPKD